MINGGPRKDQLSCVLSEPLARKDHRIPPVSFAALSWKVCVAQSSV